ncbi:pilus assembly protein CpaD [Sphingorhabdus rigui]|uniref:Pilus assembly protein CpaD n=1 Tax=Sphingorhabdus rigui TaxID=1282858 RepID=A0A840B1R2_9SPHN|nr:CpaD family pilus assembly lipoprotein [Sphingorhabdus rigui]MBB3943146.1 pilus assembly protein CpaD [Sphingorhabdus rigui]
MQKVTFLIAVSLGLAGCGTLPTNTSMYSVHQPVVERTNYAIDLASNGDGIAVADQKRLNEWFDVLDLRYGDRISIDSDDSDGNEDAARDVRAVAADRGIIVTQGAPATAGVIAPGNIRVVVTRSQASVPSCPDHRTTQSQNFNAGNNSNYGCAMNSNLAAMVADPEDLVRGRDNKRLDSNSGKAAVNAYKTKTGGN